MNDKKTSFKEFGLELWTEFRPEIKAELEEIIENQYGLLKDDTKESRDRLLRAAAAKLKSEYAIQIKARFDSFSPIEVEKAEARREMANTVLKGDTANLYKDGYDGFEQTARQVSALAATIAGKFSAALLKEFIPGSGIIDELL